MPGRDGTGPRGLGARTGFGFGKCCNSDGRAAGFGRGCGFGRGMGFCRFIGKDERETLTNEKTALSNRLSSIEKRLQEL